MSQQRLDRPQIRPSFQQMRRERVAERVARRILVDHRIFYTPAHRTGVCILTDVVPPR